MDDPKKLENFSPIFLKHFEVQTCILMKSFVSKECEMMTVGKHNRKFRLSLEANSNYSGL